MDSFISMAQKGYAAYEQSQKAQNNEGQQTQHQEGNQQHDYQHDGQSGGSTLPVDHGQAAKIANNESGSSGNSELFSQAMAFLGGGNHSTPVNEEHVTEAHKQVYESGDTSNVSANAIGSAAAMQVLKSFMSSGGSTENKSGGGDFQTKMIGMAMSEASKMFDKTGNQGDKQDAVNGAAATMFKLLVQSKFSGSTSSGEPVSHTGGGDSGGLGSLMKLAAQYTK